MAHPILITLHTLAGVVSFFAGCLAVRRRSYFAAYFYSLVLLVVFLLGAIAVTWTELDVATRILFAALSALGGYMIVRGAQARRILLRTDGPLPVGYVDHLGFTLVALFDGFIVITVLRLTGSGWLAAGSGVAIAVAGHFAIVRLKRSHTAWLTTRSTGLA
ncbi:MAG: hypothetical protein GEU98_28735 [Pseudonocardiaceae bacterium]|nr:hypothetical protein [Pseudonocardiaceae bacterium]